MSARAPGHFRPGFRLSLLAALVVGLFSTLVVRLWSLQVINSSSASESIAATTTRSVPVPAPRGAIVARGGQELAGDRSELVVSLRTTVDSSTTPATRVASPTTEADLAALVPGLTVASIKRQLNNEQYGPYQAVPVAAGISAAAATTIEENPGEFPGATVSSQYVRSYPQGSLSAQVIGNLSPIESNLARYEAEGYLPTDLIGASGLEQQYESVLRGKPGADRVLVDASGVTQRTLAPVAPVPGDTLVTNLDLPLEKTLASALANQMGALRAGTSSTGGPAVPADWGAAVVLGPKGQVLAMVSEPSYNNNDWVGGISYAKYHALVTEPGQPLNDYALTGEQPPGSTFKIATATAALDDGLITPSTIIYDPGYLNLPGGLVLHDAPGEHPGAIGVSTAITVSSDVFFYTLGVDFWDQRSHYGQTPIQDMAERYGLGSASGVDLPNVAVGQIDSPALTRALHALNPKAYPATQWYLADNAELAFGQGQTLVTPLELAEAYSTFADGGTRYAPEVGAAVVSAGGKLVRRVAPKVEAHVPLPASTYDAMLTGFEGAVQQSGGTAYGDFIGFPFSKWDLAGKTGTADVAPNSAKQPTAWFVAFGGPKGSSTRYTVAVEIDQAGYGADASAPVARQVFNYLYAHGVPSLSLPGGAAG